MNKLYFTKIRAFVPVVRPSEMRKLQCFYNWLKNGIFRTNFEKIDNFYQHSQPLYNVLQEEIQNLDFVQGVKFGIFGFVNKQRCKLHFFFDGSCEEICNSKAFVDVVTAESHRGLSTIYIKHNLFHQSKLGRGVALQNTHIVFFKFARDVMLVSAPSAQLGLGSELTVWYRSATSVPYGHLLIDLSVRTDDRLRYCTNTVSNPSMS